MKSSSICVGILALAVLGPSARACMSFDPERPCDNDNQIAFVGHVNRVQESGCGYDAHLRVHVVIREAFRGVRSQEVDIVTSATDCGVAFRDGQDYLIFANRQEGSETLAAHACGGTKLLRNSRKELEHLRGVAKGESRSGVYGFLTADPSDIFPPIRASKPVANVPIQLDFGNESRRAFTDAEGKYEFDLLPAGRYQIRAELSNVPESRRSFDFDVAAGACRVQPFLSVLAGRISGRLVDSRNQPVAGVFVEIQAIPPTPQPHPLQKMPTDAQGRFVHERLEAGEYLLGINLAASARDFLGKPSRYPRTYYPGVRNRGEAGLIKLEGGQNIDDLQFRLSQSK